MYILEEQVGAQFPQALSVWRELSAVVSEYGLTGATMSERETCLDFRIEKGGLHLVWQILTSADDEEPFVFVSLQFQLEGHKSLEINFSQGPGPLHEGLWSMSLIIPTPPEYAIPLSDQVAIMDKIEAAKREDVGYLLQKTLRNSDLVLGFLLTTDEWWLIARRMIEHFIGFNA